MDSGHTPSLSFTDINSDPPNDHQTELSTTGIRYDLDDGSAPALEVLDPRGDLKLRNGNLLFQVSSNVLMLSSSYFRKMLQKDAFIEGTKQPNPTDPPTKVLNDDDPASFGLMCKLLHYQDVSLPKSVQQTGSFASVCDYYGTERALSVHVSAWSRAFVQPDSQLTTQDLEELLWIAYVFSLEEAFSVFSVRLAIGLDAKSVKTLELRSMPDTLEAGLGELRQDIQRSLRNMIETAVNTLRQDKTKHLCTQYWLCDHCSRRKPLDTKKCGNCGSREFSLEYCQQASRIAWFLDWLEACHLWPTSHREDQSFQSLIEDVTSCGRPALMHTSWVHSCDAEYCPYDLARYLVKAEIQSARENAKGLQLHEYRVLRG